MEFFYLSNYLWFNLPPLFFQFNFALLKVSLLAKKVLMVFKGEKNQNQKIQINVLMVGTQQVWFVIFIYLFVLGSYNTKNSKECKI